MANQVLVVPDVQELQDALAVQSAQARAAQDAQNVNGGEQPTTVAQVAVPAAQPVHEPNADVVSRSYLLLACFALFLLSVANVHVLWNIAALVIRLVSFISEYVFASTCMSQSYVIVNRFNSEFVWPLLLYRIFCALCCGD